MDFIVSPAVLIPRPETEHIIETVLDWWLADQARARRNDQQPRQECPRHTNALSTSAPAPAAIAMALAKELPTAEIHATDISEDALEVARANAARHELSSRIKFHHADLLDRTSGRSFDFVVSNPPYVGESEEDSVQLEVRKFEPRNAVFSGPTGLEVIERLIPQAQARLIREAGWCSKSAERLSSACAVC